MFENAPRPNCVTDSHLTFLDLLRGSGVTQMFDAAPYLVQQCGVARRDAHIIVQYWMDSYGEREHPAAECGGNC